MTYPEDTICVVAVVDTQRIIQQMQWTERATARMRELGLRQEDLTAALGVKTRGAIGHYFSGRNELSAKQLSALAEKLQMSIQELWDGSLTEESEQPLFAAGSNISHGVVFKKRVRQSSDEGLVIFPVVGSHRGPNDAATLSLPRQLLANTPSLLAPHIQVAIATTDAMRGDIDPGANVFIDTRVNEFRGEGIYAYVLETPSWSESFIKRITAGINILRLSDTRGNILDLDEQGQKALKIIGKVVGALPPQPPIKLLG